MKKKILSMFLVFCFIIPCMFGLVACGKDDSENSSGSGLGSGSGSGSGSGGSSAPVKTTQEKVEDLLTEAYSSLLEDGSYVQTFTSTYTDALGEKTAEHTEANNSYGIAKISTMVEDGVETNKVEYSSGAENKNYYEKLEKDGANVKSTIYNINTKTYKISTKTHFDASVVKYNDRLGNYDYVNMINALKEQYANAETDEISIYWTYDLKNESTAKVATITCTFGEYGKQIWTYKVSNGKILTHSFKAEQNPELASESAVNVSWTVKFAYGSGTFTFDKKEYINEDWGESAVQAINIIQEMDNDVKTNGMATHWAVYYDFQGTSANIKSHKFINSGNLAKYAETESDNTSKIIEYKEFILGELQVIEESYDTEEKVVYRTRKTRDEYYKFLADNHTYYYSIDLFFKLIDEQYANNVKNVSISNITENGSTRIEVNAKLYGLGSMGYIDGTSLKFVLKYSNGKITTSSLMIDGIKKEENHYNFSNQVINFDKTGYED